MKNKPGWIPHGAKMPPVITKSSYMTYKYCNMKYYWQYVKGLEWAPATHIMQMGTDVHTAWDSIITKFVPTMDTDLRYLEAIFEGMIDPVPPKIDPLHMKHICEMEANRVRACIKMGKPELYVPISCEKMYQASIEINGHPVVIKGKPDGVFLEDDGKLLVVEIKGGEFKTYKLGLAQSECVFYKLLIEKDNAHRTEVEWGSVFFPLNNELHSQRITKRSVLGLYKKLEEILTRSEWLPPPKLARMCETCEYLGHCIKLLEKGE
jgi:CRISPR/Cas system-associated exonuclease Cas4 (RecB family)